jgi:hypothetical protein
VDKSDDLKMVTKRNPWLCRYSSAVQSVTVLTYPVSLLYLIKYTPNKMFQIEIILLSQIRIKWRVIRSVPETEGSPTKHSVLDEGRG